MQRMRELGSRARQGLSAAALLLGAALAPVGSALAETPLRFSLDWRFEGPAAPYLLALDEGWYAEEGLAVTIDSGAGSLESIPRVASGTYQMGFADINSLIKFRDQNPEVPVKAVMLVYDKPPFAVISLAGRGVAEPKDLEGKVLGAPATDGAFAQWDAFVAANAIEPEAVTIENVGFPVREPMLAEGRVDAITGFSYSSFLNLKGAGIAEEDIVVLLMADHGLELYGNAIIVNPAFAEAEPEAVRGFLRATLRGWRAAAADPEAAVEHVLPRNDVARAEIELERLQMNLRDNVVTDWVRANGMGGIDPERWARAMDQIALTYDFTRRPALEEVFDGSFLPPADERRID